MVLGSMGEDGGGVAAKAAKQQDFEKLFYGEYLFSDYVKRNQSVLPRMVQIYGNDDGPLPPGSCKGISRWFWAAKHALADAEMLCPARVAAHHFTAAGIPAFQFQFRHPAVEVRGNSPCVSVGAQHASGIPYW